MKLRWTWVILLLIAMMALWGCSDDDDDNPTGPTATPFEVLADAGKAYVNDSAKCPGVINADAIVDNLDDYTIIDIRREADYLAGHIPGAYNSSLGTLLDDLAATIPGDKPYVVVCYSGQSAGHAKIAMEMMGYTPVYSLLFGMSSWNSTLDRWTGACDNELTDGIGAETENQNDGLTDHDLPDLGAYETDTVVAERVAETLAAGFKGIQYADIQDNLDEYFIINYFGVDDYEGNGSAGVPGHIPGAYQFTPYQSLAVDQMLASIPTDVPVVVYCWTGQHSSQVTFYLNMLGYEAYSLAYGSNKLFHDQLTAHQWNESQLNDYPLEVGGVATDAFRAMAAAGAAYVNSADCPGVIAATDLHDNLENYTVIDIRQQDAYDAGHIPGAHHSSLATLLDDVAALDLATTDPIVVTCYTGQSAGHAKIALELTGYSEVYSLKFGMSSWHSSLAGSMDGNTGPDNGNALTNPETTNNNDGLTWHDYPSLEGYEAATVVQARVAWMLANGFQRFSYDDIMDNLDDYFVLNYFGEADYEGTSGETPGHIPGAYQFTPRASLGIDEMLGHLPTDMPILVYCWTGQTSSQIVAYLNMLGYEAYNLQFGSNHLFWNSLTPDSGHTWGDHQKNDFELE